MSFSSEVKAELRSRERKSLKGPDREKREYLRDAYIRCGSMSDPEKAYHFEFAVKKRDEAEELRRVMNSFSLEAKIVERKGSFVVYLKEGEQIVTMLGVMGAGKALMNFENIRIVKEMRNSVNRQVNCETANINKTVSAAVKQVEAIRFIEEKRGLSFLPDHLRELALLRLNHPEMPLKELGEMLKEPVGKSGVNHRLRRIMEYADKIKDEEI